MPKRKHDDEQPTEQPGAYEATLLADRRVAIRLLREALRFLPAGKLRTDVDTFVTTRAE